MDLVKEISVFGLGKLGATMVGCFAAAGFDVIGVDVLEESVESTAAGRAPVAEPGLQALFDKHKDRIGATSEVKEAVLSSGVSCIIVPTPSLPHGEFFTSIAQKAAAGIGEALKHKETYHLVVLTSTVLPGATERDIKTALEESSGKTCGKDFGLCYSPEFIAIGNVIDGLMNPDFFLIGEFDKKSGDALEVIYDRVRRAHRAAASQQPNNPTTQQLPDILRMSIVNAELTKIAVNTAVTAKISFANTLCRICSKLPGGDAYVVARAVGSDRRIGSKYLSPGAAFGGPCFPRDNRAFAWLAQSLGEDAPSAEATDRINIRHIDFLVEYILKVNPDAKTVGLLGLSYKPDTNLMEESQAVGMAKSLLGRGLHVVAYDPWIKKEGVTEDVEGLELLAGCPECIERADTVVLCTPHEEFKDLSPEKIPASVAVVDTWALLRDRGFSESSWYHVPGVSSKQS